VLPSDTQTNGAFNVRTVVYRQNLDSKNCKPCAKPESKMEIFSNFGMSDGIVVNEHVVDLRGE
jgi:hypothetical protein